MAVICGQDPLLWTASSNPIPARISEYEYTGWLRGRPVEVVKGPVTGLPLPASAEIVLEGELLRPGIDDLQEGPFGEWPGYYASGVKPEPAKKPRPRARRLRKLTFNEERELEALPQLIESLEEEQAALTEKMADPAFYQEDKTLISEARQRLAALENELIEAFNRWEELEEVREKSAGC